MEILTLCPPSYHNWGIERSQARSPGEGALFHHPSPLQLSLGTLLSSGLAGAVEGKEMEPPHLGGLAQHPPIPQPE